MSLDQTTSSTQLDLLATHRRTLMVYLRQAAIFGVLTPPHVVHGIEEARAAIAQLKSELRTAGLRVNDAPGDLAGTASIERKARWLRLLKAFISCRGFERCYTESERGYCRNSDAARRVERDASDPA